MVPAAQRLAGSPGGREDDFTVVLKEVGANKITYQGSTRGHEPGLKEAKGPVDGAPKSIKEGVSKEEAETIKKKFTEAAQLSRSSNSGRPGWIFPGEGDKSGAGGAIPPAII